MYSGLSFSGSGCAAATEIVAYSANVGSLYNLRTCERCSSRTKPCVKVHVCTGSWSKKGSDEGWCTGLGLVERTAISVLLLERLERGTIKKSLSDLSSRPLVRIAALVQRISLRNLHNYIRCFLGRLGTA